MTIEAPKVNPISRLPINALEQLKTLPTFEERERILASLFTDVGKLLSGEEVNIDMEKSSYRVKPEERIQAKIDRRGSADPILDLYAMRFIMEDSSKRLAVQLIKEGYPTPDIFPWGKPSYRDYSDPEVRRQFASRFNPNIDDWYTAIHLDIIFGDGPILNIAEVQLRTPEEHGLAEKRRLDYLEAQRLMMASRGETK